jgi:hypothetical protein
VISLIIVSFTATAIIAQDNSIIDNHPKYSQVRIFFTSQQEIQRLANSGLFLDHGIRKGNFFQTWLSEEEIKMLQSSGVSYIVTIPDWDSYYNSLPKMTTDEIQQAIQESVDNYNVSHSIYGTMSGHLKWEEALAKIDSMKIEYPGLISNKFSIGNSYENKPLWTVRVSNNPEVVSGKPQIWLNGITHAREPVGMTNILYFMYWLFENYNIDPIASYILNNREIYVTPFINPDGYVYNQTTNPSGGGMWRKNRTPQGSAIGVDLNRNYGIYQFWNSPNGGSSTNPSSSTYRGTAPFSEPETQVVRDFTNSMNLKTALTYHMHGNYLLRPWAWCDPIAPPDSMIFHEWGADMIQFNHYLYGTGFSLLNYRIRGDANDWMHHDSGHTKIFAYTPEIGNWFWPTQAEILPLAQGCVWMNIYISMVAGAFIYPDLAQFNQQYYSPGNSGSLRVLFKNKGLASAQNVKIHWTSLSSYITIPTSVYNYPSISQFVSDSSLFSFSISGSVPNNSAIPTVLNFKQEDTNIVHTENLYVLIGTGLTTFADSAENGFGNWTTNQGWAITTSQYHTPTHSFTDSPIGSYQNNANNSMTLSTPINITSYPIVYLSFWHKYNTEAGYDYCNVEISSDNGSTWQKVSSYDGIQSGWTQEIFDITSYANGTSQLKIRFTLNSDTYITADGWYVDDIKLTNYANVLTNVDPFVSPPLKYSLSQNYPNPFNPNTTIKFEIPREEFTQLVIYDALGREVAKLLNKDLTAGSYEVEWNAENYGSGIYFYQLKAGNYNETRKMMLLK